MASPAKPLVKDQSPASGSAMRKLTIWVPQTETPEFEAEYRRQMAVLSEHYRSTNFADFLEPDAEDVKGWI